MPRPLRTVKAPSATAKKSSTTTKAGTKSRTTRLGAKDIPNVGPKEPAPLPASSSNEPSKKPSSTRKATVTNAKTPLTKRSTRSKAPTITTEEAVPAPKHRTTRRKPTAKEPALEQEQEPGAKVEKIPQQPEPLLPSAAFSSLPPPLPEIQVPASSNAENRTPSPQFRSSPPPMAFTPPPQTATRHRMVLEFSSDAGYSPPPPARPTSADRPRLRELQAVSLDPLDCTESEVDEENADPRASPTPKRGRKSGFVPIVEGEQGGRPSAFYISNADEEAFTIYSDPKSPTPPTLPRNTASDDTMRPPESSPTTTPAKMRKRRSSGAVVDSDDDVAEQGDLEDEVEKAAVRKGKRRKAIGVKEQVMTTAVLRGILPRRKNTKAEGREEYDVPSTSEDVIESEYDSGDELSHPTTGRTTRSGRAGAKTSVKPRPAKTNKAAKKATTKSRNSKATAAPKVSTSTRVSKTYSRKSISSEKENDPPTNLGNRKRQDSAVDVAGPSSSDETIVADMDKNGRRKLKEVVEKFMEVDRWEMEFEDISPGSLLEADSEGAR